MNSSTSEYETSTLIEIAKRLYDFFPDSTHQEACFETVVLKNDIAGAFVLMDRRILTGAYTSILDLITDNDKYELFLDAYTQQEVGRVEPEIVEEIYKLRPKKLIAAA